MRGKDKEKLQQYIDWQTSRVISKVRTTIGDEAALSLMKLEQLGLAKIKPSDKTNEMKP